ATLKPQYENTNFADRSYKVDFYLLGSSGINYLIEFKTDQSSRRDKQDIYLREAREVKMKAIVDGICHIAQVSTYKSKYSYLLDKLFKLGLIDKDRRYSGKSQDVDIIYIQPQDSKDNKCICFNWISNWMRQKYNNNDFELQFALLLQEWAT
ncbi:unnamed protein product, partial [marine sediment metagenome]